MIDDDFKLCDVVKKALLKEDADLDHCDSDLIGIDKLKTNEYQAVILDVMLPGIDGFKTLRQIREFSAIPILILS